jgi:hypothetical protein
LDPNTIPPQGDYHRFFIPVATSWRPKRGYGFFNQVTVLIDDNTKTLANAQQRIFVVVDSQEVYSQDGGTYLGAYVTCLPNGVTDAGSQFKWT